MSLVAGQAIPKDEIFHQAQTRWLSPETIEFVLLNFSSLGLELHHSPPQCPQNGQIYLLNRDETKSYKLDGVNWQKKKGQGRVQETYQSIKICGEERILGVYCRAADNENFQKRIYRLSQFNSPIVLIHYRDCPTSHSTRSADQQVNLQEQLFQVPTQQRSGLHPAITSAATLSSSLPPAVSLATVVDFAPNQCDSSGGTKVLFVFGSAVPGEGVEIFFGENRAVTEIIAWNVVRCWSPAMPPGRTSIWIAAQGQVLLSLSPQRGMDVVERGAFEGIYRADVVGQPGQPSGNSLVTPLEFPGRPSLAAGTNSGLGSVGLPPNTAIPGAANNAIAATPRPVRARSLTDESMEQQDNKIRIIEYRPAGKEIDADVSSSVEDKKIKHETDVEDNYWIDDRELGNLTPSQVETRMDDYLMNVVQQLVELAAVDEDLLLELDSLDNSGYSLLHYCSLYNLTSSIPILLNRGASANQQTDNCGSTALHLAAGAGHLQAVKLLVAAGGIDLNIADFAGNAPVDLARSNNHEEVVDFLEKTRSSAAPTDNNSCQCKVPSVLVLASKPVRSLVHIPPLPLPILESLSNKAEFGNSAVSSHLNMSTSNNSSRKILQQAFSSLSLADKCAFAISLRNQFQHSNSASVRESSGGVDGLAAKEGLLPESTQNYDGVMTTDRSSAISEVEQGLNDSTISASSPGEPSFQRRISLNGDSEPNDQLDSFDIHSVISESDKENLDFVMSMMGHLEMTQIEDEVRTIQNNVRGWLLRKNYNNLRGAAKTLQIAWREWSHGKRHHQGNNQEQNRNKRLGDASENLLLGPVAETSEGSSPSSEFRRLESQEMSQEYHSPMPEDCNLFEDEFDATIRMLADDGSTDERLSSTSKFVPTSDSSVLSFFDRTTFDTLAVQDSTSPDSNKLRFSPMSEIGDEANLIGSDNNPGDNDTDNSNQLTYQMGTFLSSQDRTRVIVEVSSSGRNNQVDSAAATLQRATRRMIARRSFASIRKQAIASLVIQKGLMTWWAAQRGGSVGEGIHRSQDFFSEDSINSQK